MIELGKKYRLANGGEVELYSVGNGGLFPVHGRYRMLGDHIWHSGCWAETGKYQREEPSVRDLIEVRPRHKRTVWIAPYNSTGADLYVTFASKEDADRFAGSSSQPLAIVKCKLDFAEGDGL